MLLKRERKIKYENLHMPELLLWNPAATDRANFSEALPPPATLMVLATNLMLSVAILMLLVAP